MNQLLKEFNFSKFLPQNQDEMLRIRFKNLETIKEEMTKKVTPAPKKEVKKDTFPSGRRTNFVKKEKPQSALKVSYNQKKRSLEMNSNKPEKPKRTQPKPKPEPPVFKMDKFVETKPVEKQPVLAPIVQQRREQQNSSHVESVTRRIQDKPISNSSRSTIPPVQPKIYQQRPLQVITPVQAPVKKQKFKRFVPY